MTLPKILVAMPVFNGEKYLYKAIDSILSQTYSEFIFLIINDGSSDGSGEIAHSFKDRRIMVWDQPNQGPGIAMNRAIEYACDQNIPFIARMDADDISLPQRFETQLQLLNKFPSTAACSANCHYIDSESEEIIGSSTVSISPKLVKWEISHGLRGLIQGACVFRSDMLANIKGYRAQFRNAEEVDVFLRLSDHFELRNCREYLYNIRIHSDSLSLSNNHRNILYQHYALDCANRRRKGRSENDFATFQSELSPLLKLSIWREDKLLNYWRQYMQGKKIHILIMASLLDPRRVWIRALRRHE